MKTKKEILTGWRASNLMSEIADADRVTLKGTRKFKRPIVLQSCVRYYCGYMLIYFKLSPRSADPTECYFQSEIVESREQASEFFENCKKQFSFIFEIEDERRIVRELRLGQFEKAIGKLPLRVNRYGR